jgi:hypothetical protein
VFNGGRIILDIRYYITIQPSTGSCKSLYLSNITSAFYIPSYVSYYYHFSFESEKNICSKQFAPHLQASVLYPGLDTVLMPYFFNQKQTF